MKKLVKELNILLQVESKRDLSMLEQRRRDELYDKIYS